MPESAVPNRLPIPKDLAHLIEKRDEPERRGSSRRKKRDASPSGSTIEETIVPATSEATQPIESTPEADKGSSPVRRRGADRRKAKRRNAGTGT